jgi:hypothetical protein
MDTNTSTQSPAGQSPALAVDAWLGLLGNYATAADVEAEKKHFDESTPLEIVTISAILKGLEEYAQETANDEMADGFTGEEASGRAMAYYETRERLQAYWSRSP